ncbi:MAG TPA: hypothetical protein VGC79_28415, partial [Polyangiaceae bacterium]
IKNVFERYSSRNASILLLVALSIQVLDTSAGWLTNRTQLMRSGSTWSSPLQSPFWAQVPGMYRALLTVPVRSMGPHWEDLAYFAAMHEMSTDAVYLARIDLAKRDAATRRGLQSLRSGKYQPGAVYVVDRAYESAARRGARAERDLVAWVDGFLVVAPDWKCRPQCLAQAAKGQADCSATCAKTPD